MGMIEQRGNKSFTGVGMHNDTGRPYITGAVSSNAGRWVNLVVGQEVVLTSSSVN